MKNRKNFTLCIVICLFLSCATGHFDHYLPVTETPDALAARAKKYRNARIYSLLKHDGSMVRFETYGTLSDNQITGKAVNEYGDWVEVSVRLQDAMILWGKKVSLGRFIFVVLGAVGALMWSLFLGIGG